MEAGNARVSETAHDGAQTAPVQVLWGQACAQLQSEIGIEKFASWVKPLKVGTCDDGTICLFAPNAFCRDWVRENLGRRLNRAWLAADPLCRAISIRLGAHKPDQGPHHDPVTPRRVAQPSASGTGAGSGFDTFVVDASNDVAFTVARQVSNGVMASFNNPFFVYGGYGVGKTHLLRAITESVFWTHPGRQVRYLTAEEFVYDYVTALRERNTHVFKQNTRSLDLLLVDDLQFILGKQASQDELFHTLNAMTSAGAQLVFSADQAPGALAGLHPGLASRIAGGLVCEIRAASESLRRQILERRVELLAHEYHGLAVPPAVLDIIAEEICTNPRELIGALNTILSRTAFIGRPLTEEWCREILADLVRDPARKVSIAEIQKAVASHYELSVEQLLSRRRTRNIVRPRQIAMYLCKQVTTCSLPMIGGRFDGRDHATVIHANRQITSLMTKDQAIADDIKAIRRALMAPSSPQLLA